MANGNFAGGDGSELNPYLIEDAHDLNAIRDNLTAHYKLINDIDLDVAPYNEGEGWVPISPFAGGLEGEGHSIGNLNYGVETPSRGLFGNLNGAKVRNLEVINVNVAGNTTGALAGYSTNNTLIENVKTSGVVLLTAASQGFAGGIIGYCYESPKIHNSYSLCSVIGTGSNKGGVTGRMISSQLDNTYSVGLVEGPHSSFIGGLSGSKEGTSEVFNSFWDMETSGQTQSYGGVGLTTGQAKDPQTYLGAGWGDEVLEDGTPVWILEDGEYPKLWFEVSQAKYQIETDEGIIDKEGNIVEFIDFDIYGFELKKLQEYMRSSLNIVKIYGDRDILYGRGNKILEGEILAMLDVDKKTIPIAKTDIIPKARLIKPKGDIVFKMLNSIEEMTLFADTSSEGVIKVIFSTDSGYSWNSYTNEGLISIDINNLSEVKEKGLSPDEFNKINKLWSSIITDDKIRFAYYLEIDSKADMAAVDKLEVKMNMYGRWNKVKEEDYDYGYDNDHLYINFYKDGSYKINYQK